MQAELASRRPAKRRAAVGPSRPYGLPPDECRVAVARDVGLGPMVTRRAGEDHGHARGSNNDSKERGPMPYCEPHHSRRDKIVDLEVMRLELRATARQQPRSRGGKTGTIVRFPRTFGSTGLPPVA